MFFVFFGLGAGIFIMAFFLTIVAGDVSQVPFAFAGLIALLVRRFRAGFSHCIRPVPGLVAGAPLSFSAVLIVRVVTPALAEVGRLLLSIFDD